MKITSKEKTITISLELKDYEIKLLRASMNIIRNQLIMKKPLKTTFDMDLYDYSNCILDLLRGVRIDD